MLYCDYPLSYQMGFQDPGANWLYGIIDLHDRIMFYLIIVLIIVLWFMIKSIISKQHMAYLHHGNTLELIWTISPAIILWAIGIPSLRLLYMMDEILDASLTVKVQGFQWYWNYEYSDYARDKDNDTNNISFSSYMIALNDLNLGDIRNLHVDNYLVLPINTAIRFLVSSNDVIHSFALPSLAIKCDAIPGRLNQTGLIIHRPSIYYGQCSELCGSLHGFMPIGVKAVTTDSYISFIKSNII